MNSLTKNSFLKTLPFQNERGSLLIFILFLLMTMSLFAFSVGYAVKQKLQVVSRLETREKLRYLSEGAVKKALDTVNLKQAKAGLDFSALNQPWADGENFREIKMGGGVVSITPYEIKEGTEPVYGLRDEESKVNLNQAKPAVLRVLFEKAGLDQESARMLAASVQDWRDEDEDLTDGGAESKEYRIRKPPYRSKNALFSTLEELWWVKGVDPEIFEKIAPYLTLTGTQININTAPANVLFAYGLDSGMTAKIVNFRKGKDGIQGTKDDGVFLNLAEVPEVLSRYSYLTDQEQQGLASLLNGGAFTVQSRFYSGIATGKLDHQKAIMKSGFLFEKEKGIRQWHEKFSSTSS